MKGSFSVTVSVAHGDKDTAEGLWCWQQKHGIVAYLHSISRQQRIKLELEADTMFKVNLQ